MASSGAGGRVSSVTIRAALLLPLLLQAALISGCAVATAPGTAGVVGRVRLVPNEGVTPVQKGSAVYADRRLRDVEPVDYDRPGFAVVYVEGATAPRGTVEVAVAGSRRGPRFEPREAAVGLGGKVRVRNGDAVAHPLSVPGAGLVRALGPGEAIEVPAAAAGPLEVFLLDAPEAAATVFVAPGPFAVAAPSGRFELLGVPPCRGVLRAWHARFPSRPSEVDLRADQVVERDVELGVGALGSKP